MKTRGVVILFFLFVPNLLSYSQVTVVGQIRCEVISALIIQNISGLDFGNIKKTKFERTIVIEPGAVPSPSHATLSENNRSEISATITEDNHNEQNAHPSIFYVLGEPNTEFSISLPTSTIIILSDGNDNMVVDSFNSIPSTKGILSANGMGAISVGATLHISSNQTKGTYKSTSGYEIKINYN